MTYSRIISLVPSQTELLYDLGLRDEVAGITKFCIHPDEWFRTKPRIGGTKQLNIEKIRKLDPDLIIANKEENVKEQVEELEKHFPVITTDVNTLEDALEMISLLGKITGRSKAAEEMISAIRYGFDNLTVETSMRTCYLIWNDPYMTIGGDTFINDMMARCGFFNIFSDKKRYPVLTIDQLSELDCQVLMLSSEPFPFKIKHKEELQELLPGIKIVLVDGEMFSWYGSRLLKAPAYFTRLKNEILSLMHAGS
jgi:ABC-type Fe3+-hydroxamate transport system substrate-binding protein